MGNRKQSIKKKQGGFKKAMSSNSMMRAMARNKFMVFMGYAIWVGIIALIVVAVINLHK